MKGISRRSLVLGTTLALPVLSVVRAEGRKLLTPEQRQHLVLETRREAAQAEFTSRPPLHVTNFDEDRYPDKRASFSKTMPHNDLGEVEPEAYRQWLAILARGDAAGFDQAPRAPQAVERLNDPQATYATDLVGPDATALVLPPPPAFASREMAAQMTELYWLALMRDVPFRDYGTDALALAAVADLRLVGFPRVDTANLFRGGSAGELRGPFVSQFLWHDIPYGLKIVDQRFSVPTPGQNFLIGFEDWLACQRGARTKTAVRFNAEPRYIATYRSLAEYVHRDFSFQPFMDAALIILRMGGERGDDVLSPTNPYRGSSTQFGDITLGSKNLLTLLAQASLLAQKASYYQKWQVHRRARPETVAGRIDVHLSGRKSYDINPAISHSDAMARTKEMNGSYLLSMAYPEGCPTHPSYPAAHALNAGACATILKAFVNESYKIPQPVEASADGSRLEPWRGDALLLGDEIDKLASNIALARDAAGVHFRSDSISGLTLGEDVAIGLLADYSRTYSERFDGFALTRFDGARVRISGGVAQSW